MTSPARARKTVDESKIEMSQLMRPQHANFAGNVHGGTILALMDEVAYTCASRYAGAYCVTVAVDQVEFVAPVRVGDVVTLRASVNHVGTSSMDIGISIRAENPRDPGSERLTNRSYMTMVALDDDGRPTAVPELILNTPQHKTWACEARLRRKLREQHRQTLAAGACDFEPDLEG